MIKGKKIRRVVFLVCLILSVFLLGGCFLQNGNNESSEEEILERTEELVRDYLFIPEQIKNISLSYSNYNRDEFHGCVIVPYWATWSAKCSFETGDDYLININGITESIISITRYPRLWFNNIENLQGLKSGRKIYHTKTEILIAAINYFEKLDMSVDQVKLYGDYEQREILLYTNNGNERRLAVKNYFIDVDYYKEGGIEGDLTLLADDLSMQHVYFGKAGSLYGSH